MGKAENYKVAERGPVISKDRLKNKYTLLSISTSSVQ